MEPTRDSLARHQRVLGLLATMAEQLNRYADLVPMLETALSLVCDLLGARQSWLVLLEGSGSASVSRVVRVPEPGPTEPGRTRGGEPLCGCLRRWLARRTGAGEGPRRSDPVCCHTTLPLALDDQLLGIVSLEFPAERALGREDLDLLHLVGGTLSLAIHRAQLCQRARASERDARRQLAAVLEALPDLVATADAEGRLLHLNPAGRRMLGIGDNEDIASLNLAGMHAPWSSARILLEGLPTAMREGVWRGESALLRRDGQEIPVSEVILAHRHDDGRLKFFATVAHDISERKHYEEQLLRLADHDALTGLYNRRRFQEEIERALAHTRRYGGRGALLFIDLDRFKQVNDSLGHRVGDDVLTELGLLLRERLRASDIAGRWGGDEFAVLLPQADASRAQAVAEQLLELFRERLVALGGQRLEINASIGIALYPEHGANVADLLTHADIAMYQAKRRGGAVCLYAPGQREQLQLSVQLPWRRRLREALEHDLFTLYYQPIVDLRHGAISQYELLLRLMGERGEVIRPRAFLSAAERSGLIHDIDQWMVRNAIGLLASTAALASDARLHVNLSVRTLADHQLLRMLERELAAARIDPGRLVFEISEAAVLVDLPRTRRFVESVQKLGCQLALDDFSFSSSYRIKRVPVDYLKIDGMFVQNLSQDVADQHLVRAMVEVARGLGARTVAKFVGDEATARLLRTCGVDLAQGNHLGPARPIPEPWAQARRLLEGA